MSDGRADVGDAGDEKEEQWESEVGAGRDILLISREQRGHEGGGLLSLEHLLVAVYEGNVKVEPDKVLDGGFGEEHGGTSWLTPS